MQYYMNQLNVDSRVIGIHQFISHTYAAAQTLKYLLDLFVFSPISPFPVFLHDSIQNVMRCSRDLRNSGLHQLGGSLVLRYFILFYFFSDFFKFQRLNIFTYVLWILCLYYCFLCKRSD